MEAIEVGVREFREKLSDYILHNKKPVAVTRHGATVGYFIPTQSERGLEKLRTLRAAGAAVDAMLAKAQTSETEIEAIAREFAAVRKTRRGTKA
jgi:antitoxin (DNA-binding transcriptional repressor) of toxin-antitoxin stability system